MNRAPDQVQIEQQLAASLYRLGTVLSEQADIEVIRSHHRIFMETLRQLSCCSPFERLNTTFKIDKKSRYLLTLAYICTMEPDAITSFLNTSWYEQGPSLSLYRATHLLTDTLPSSQASTLDWLNSPLRRWHLITANGPVSHSLHLDETVLRTLAGLSSGIEQTTLPATLNTGHAICYSNQLQQTTAPIITIDCGNPDERLHWILSKAATLGHDRCIILDTPEIPDNEQLRYLLRDIALDNSDPFIYWPQGAAMCQIRPALTGILDDWRQLNTGCIVCDQPEPSTAGDAAYYRSLLTATFTPVNCPQPDEPTRCGLWQQLGQNIGNNGLTMEQAQWLARLYPFMPGRIAQICQSAEELDDNETLLTQLQHACLTQYQSEHPQLATLSPPGVSWTDMVLTANTRQQLQELILRVRYSSELSQQLTRFKPGLQALFWGKPGTGKSMAAEAMAAELVLPLYKINLANVASKWIGESEKHLASLFDQAERQHAILLFDEADAIFGRRSEISSSHDKHANMGVSYLLQRMEHYQGLLLLSTNFKSNLDEAFLRRLHSVIEFPLPDISTRLSLWQHALRGQYQPATNIGLDSLAAAFEFSPAQIANIAELAMLYCLAEQHTRISADILARAILRELDKHNAGYLAIQKVNQWLKGQQ
ncbi:ATP-binding protein [Gynuella sunshinyii]|uniref:ATPase of the AAA+ class n=1 Tax=Gynuella sunshinyii YC6258 TaxID=1445510 RepID=A0A0C5VLR9_9GAMM|nr:ATP-binding protein [Gynuella sunshinyii]AJQ94263.1 ATPase of the AAA+ class [Gynuella sunshinyii YC6258]